MLCRRQKDTLAMLMDATFVVLNPIIGSKVREYRKAQRMIVLMRAVAESADHRTSLTKTRMLWQEQ